jgi:predicted transcriptional regulator
MVESGDWIDFHPNKEDLAKVLGGLEADIMRAVWERGPGDVKTIHQRLAEERRVAVTTIATVLDRLHSKGLVERELVKGGGIRYEYRAAMSRKQFEGAVVRNVFKGLFETFGESAVNYLVQNAEALDRDALEELRRNL